MKTSRRLVMWALLAALFFVGTVGHAQQSGMPAPHKVYTNKTGFKLPLRIDTKERSQIHEVQLYVKNGPNDAWTLKAAVPPSQKEFVYRASEDGEYWFCIVAVDHNGKKSPGDLRQEPPGLIVVVDRQVPEVDVHPVNSTSGQPLLKCEVHDANPDPTKIKIEYQTSDQRWQVLEPSPNQPGTFQVSDPSAFRGIVRATVTDRAGNTAKREINLALTAPAPSAVITKTTTPGPQGPVVTAAIGSPNNVIQTSYDSLVPQHLETQSNKMSVAPASTASGSLQLLNTTHANLKYQLDPQYSGPSGRVEVWMTRDEGQTWQRLCEDPGCRGQVTFDLPGDGKYGLTLVVNNGFAMSQPPARGDVPDYRIEVDTTKPTAQLLAVRPGIGQDAGSFLITWTAADQNLKAEPVTLEYANHLEGPWVLIARGVKNNGNFRWSKPHEATGSVFVRLQVSDQAGNTTVCTTPQPIVLDCGQPKARILEVVGGPNALAPGTN